VNQGHCHGIRSVLSSQCLFLWMLFFVIVCIVPQVSLVSATTTTQPNAGTTIQHPTGGVSHNSHSQSKPSHSSEFNFASSDVGAKIISATPEAVSVSRILNEDHDRYMLIPKANALDSFFFVVELSEVVSMRRIAVANFEYYSCSMKTFKLYGRVKENESWENLGIYEADNSKSVQTFELDEPKLVRYILLNVTSIYSGSDSFYCTMSLLRVHGETLYQDLVNLMNPDEMEPSTEDTVYANIDNVAHSVPQGTTGQPADGSLQNLAGSTGTADHVAASSHPVDGEEELLARVRDIAQEDAPITLPDIESSSLNAEDSGDPIVDPELLERLVDRSVIDKISLEDDALEELDEEMHDTKPLRDEVESDSSTRKVPTDSDDKGSLAGRDVQPPEEVIEKDSTEHEKKDDLTNPTISDADPMTLKTIQGHESVPAVDLQSTENDVVVQKEENHKSDTLQDLPQTNVTDSSSELPTEHSNNTLNTSKTDEQTYTPTENGPPLQGQLPTTENQTTDNSETNTKAANIPPNNTTDTSVPTNKTSPSAVNNSTNTTTLNITMINSESNVTIVNGDSDLGSQVSVSGSTPLEISAEADQERAPKKPLKQDSGAEETLTPENDKKDEKPDPEIPKKPIESQKAQQQNQSSTDTAQIPPPSEGATSPVSQPAPHRTETQSPAANRKPLNPKLGKGGRENILKSMLSTIQNVGAETNQLTKQMRSVKEQYKEAFQKITSVLAQKSDEINVLAESILTLRKKNRRYRAECKEADDALKLELERELTNKIYNKIEHRMREQVESFKKQLRDEYQTKLTKLQYLSLFGAVLAVVVNVYVFAMCTGSSGERQRASGKNQPAKTTVTSTRTTTIGESTKTTDTMSIIPLHRRTRSYNHTLDALVDDWNSEEDEMQDGPQRVASTSTQKTSNRS